jgi:hypothetical protein
MNLTVLLKWYHTIYYAYGPKTIRCVNELKGRHNCLHYVQLSPHETNEIQIWFQWHKQKNLVCDCCFCHIAHKSYKLSVRTVYLCPKKWMNGNLQITYFTSGCQDFEGTNWLWTQRQNDPPKHWLYGTKYRTDFSCYLQLLMLWSPRLSYPAYFCLGVYLLPEQEMALVQATRKPERVNHQSNINNT